MIDPALLTLITVIVGFFVQWMREGRQHKWDADERERLAEDARIDRAAGEARVTGHIETNTDISTKAFHEANSVNLKLHALGLEQLAQAADAHAKEPKP